MTQLPVPATSDRGLDDRDPGRVSGSRTHGASGAHAASDHAFAAALASLPGMGPRRLAALLHAWPAADAWERVSSGRRAALDSDQRVAELLRRSGDSCDLVIASWARAAALTDVALLSKRHRDAGIHVMLRGDPSYPDVLEVDIEPPTVVFSRGDLHTIGDGPRVAIVGTRRCTGVGAGFARELGRDLASEGVMVVSGLALGIDGAAHRGVLDAGRAGLAAPPVGVVGSGIDVVYPARHHDLWEWVATDGVMISETPAGVRPAAWRFPARNRIIAALADVVVVVESHAKGGSLHTVDEAQRRGIPVMAVPGSVRSSSAGGTNALIADGCYPVCDAGDVLLALGLTSRRSSGAREHRPAPDQAGHAVLHAFDWEPATLEHLAVRTGLDLSVLSLTLEVLQSQGWVTLDGGWYERVGSS